VKCGTHLSLESIDLAPAAEWKPEGAGWCFLRVSRHCGYWLGEGQALEAGPGDVLVLSPLRAGYFRASQLGSVTLHQFRFSPDLAGGLLTPVEHELFERLAGDAEKAVRLHGAGSEGAALWQALLAQPDAGSGLICRTELLRIVARLLAAELEQPLPAARPFLPARLKLRLLLNQMPEAEFVRLTARDLALRCGVSVVQINRTFRQLLGESLREHQELIRLRSARQTLAESNCSLEAVALEAGFRDTRSFNAAFKKRFGLAPLDWRRPGPRGNGPGRPGHPGKNGSSGTADKRTR
jgi:AraC-like DNA-binding protein